MNPLSELVTGGWILRDWLGKKGIPVAKELAESRAMICVSCPKNVEPNWWDRVLNRIALMIRHQLELKHEMGLWVSKEGDINMCQACGCCLRLKVHVPLEHIKDHTSDEVLRAMPDFCWIRKELDSEIR